MCCRQEAAHVVTVHGNQQKFAKAFRPSNKAARLRAFLETYRVLLIAEGANSIPAVWRVARAAVHGVGEAACREAACLHGCPYYLRNTPIAAVAYPIP